MTLLSLAGHVLLRPPRRWFESAASSNKRGQYPCEGGRVVPEVLVCEEAKQLRDDIAVVRVMVDAALHHGLDHRLVDACTSVYRERHERLEELEELELARSGRSR
jgi:hypothetical protein